MTAFQKLQDWANAHTVPALIPHTRVHPVTMPDGNEWYLKREDETGMLTSGGKMRKMASLLYHFQQQNFKSIYFEAGWQSNNALSMFSICKERSISCKMIAPKPIKEPGNAKGNALFLRLLASEEEIIALEDGQTFGDYANQFPLNHPDMPILWVPEGIDCLEGMAGALTLLSDILRNEAETGRIFDPVWMDAGTGISAIGMILANYFLERPKTLLVVGMADEAAVFRTKLEKYATQLEKETGLKIPENEIPYRYFRPFSGKSFGSVNSTNLNISLEISRSTGILADPIYMAKLMGTAMAHQKLFQIQDAIPLMVHSGGNSSISGFSDHFARLY